MKYVIDGQVLQNVLDYLSAQPYGVVFSLVEQIQAGVSALPSHECCEEEAHEGGS